MPMKPSPSEQCVEVRVRYGDNPWSKWKPGHSHYGEWGILTTWSDEPELHEPDGTYHKAVLAIKTGKTIRQWRLL